MSTLKTIKLQNPSGASSNIDLGTGGEVLIGSATTTGTASQTLQVTGGAYVSGNLGVGVTNPSYKSHIVSSGDILALESTSTTDRTSLKFLTNGSDWELGARGSAETFSSNSFYLFDNGTSYYRMVLNSSGNIGIGSISSSNIKGTLNLDKSSSSGTVASIPSIVLSNRNQTDANFVHSGIFADMYRDVANPSYTAGIWFQRVPEITNLSSGGNIIFGANYNVNENSLPLERARITYQGYFKASDDSSYYSSSGSYHEFRNSTNNDGIVETATNASYSSYAYRTFVTRASTTAYFFYEARSGGTADIEFLLRGDGNAFADGTWSGGGADYAEMFEWEDENPDNEDRRGYSVSLVGNKIKIAEEGDEIIGVISGNPSVIGDTAWNKWSEKYLRDDFGSYITETHNVVEWTDEDGKEHSYEDWNLPNDVVVPDDATIKTHDDKGNRFTHRKLNPEYNPDLEYVSREDRPEWDAVGMMGKLRLRKGQPVRNTWIKMRDISESVEEWLVR